ITTGMFYVGGDTWAVRFTGTRPGTWELKTTSADKDLDGRRSAVMVEARAGNGFLTAEGRDWVFSGNGKAFLPQYVMAPSVDRLNEAAIDDLIATFIGEHGFSGFHLSMQCRWFDMTESSCADVGTPNPDQETFERLELLIRKTHAAGGAVHLWMWGDSQRDQNPARWGLNGKVDQRMQRYIAARLGPLPGWTMGYGYDLFEWVTAAQLDTWHRFMQTEMGWPHLLGARGATNELTQISENLDYTSYEYWQPSPSIYRQMVERRPNKPVFAEDRYRIYPANSTHAYKSYTSETTRRGLWHAAWRAVSRTSGGM
ncbi:MAG: DUF5060 domain-containing protein, partial [Oscillochloris sp.]|nr:DUF5060 domain-containing protein [Oscillochloris sp.]